MQNGEIGYDEVKSVIIFFTEFTEAAVKAKGAKGPLDRGKPFLMLLDEIWDLVDLDAGELQAQYDAMTEEDWEALLTDVKVEFDLDDDGLEEKVENVFKAAIEIIKIQKSLLNSWSPAA